MPNLHKIHKIKLIYYFLFILCLTIFNGCTTLNVNPQNIVSYNNGIAIIQSNHTTSKMQFEIAQQQIGGIDNEPLLIYITGQNLTNEQLTFDTNNITVQNNNTSLHVLRFQELPKYNLNLSDALYAYGKDIEIDNIQITDPFFSSVSYFSPFPLYFSRGFGYRFYDYSFARVNIQAAQNAQLQRKAKQILIANYLRKNTLTQSDTKGGFIAIPYDRMQSGVLLIKVRLGSDIHTLQINLNNAKTAHNKNRR
ncbi:hypothetical protein CQA66_01825 [Helicobacter aurati]|uniref:Uncharacterized protein n=1 Tax=Helicobacter aurati TaxID=137778 RepID=A0A3D8J977_9HELI|nr:hypothetical protein [Helicobacter aurati]RDU73424.1 hypothetical protein CQA66_01825 [Helicobacter aurati]